jgi:asparagine synthase (glutamine-hydrolysing)
MSRFFALLGPEANRLPDAATAALTAPPCALTLVADALGGGVARAYAYEAPRGPTLAAVGEATLFNAAELHAELHQRGVATEGCSDGELLLRAYALDGPAAFARADGMFALAIWDGLRLALVRDPLGARTLFYTRAANTWAAASSLRALRRWPLLGAQLNLAAVRSFLTFAYLPGDETLLEGVDELLPGRCLLLAADGAHELIHYWEPVEAIAEPQAAPEAYIARLRAQLERATVSRLPPAEPVGVFLSGGIDSSLVTALAARHHDQAVHTYAISFGAELPNELGYSGLVAAHCRTRHRVLSFNGAQIAKGMAETVALLDCPVGDPLTVPNLLLARAAAADGLRVILNGEGGDPVFGGPKNLPMLLFELQRPSTSSETRLRAYLRSYRKCYNDLPALLSREVQHALRDAPPLERLIAPYLAASPMRSYLNQLLHCNLRTKGAHHILTKVERLTASCGLEGRAPLFDRAVVEAAFATPPTLKLRGSDEKWVLKQAVRDLLPSTIIERPKSGMRVPVQTWLRGPLRALAHDLLLGRQARTRGLFQPATIRAWLRGEGALYPRQGGKLWLILTLELWLRAFLDRVEIDDEYFAHHAAGR